MEKVYYYNGYKQTRIIKGTAGIKRKTIEAFLHTIPDEQLFNLKRTYIVDLTIQDLSQKNMTASRALAIKVLHEEIKNRKRDSILQSPPPDA